ncbi:MAG: exo-beta-N-acetylmuramidase NamZ family protein [Bacteroides sp.]
MLLNLWFRERYILPFLVFMLVHPVAAEVVVGAARFGDYLPQLKNKRVGLVCNHTSRIGETTMLWDTLQALDVKLVRLFTPEHGLEGLADAGECIKGVAKTSKLPEVVSLYNHTKRPPLEKVRDLDIVLFDLQDVGVRCYTYISTMHNVMEVCARAGVPFMVLDRPNPNGHYVDGPVLSLQYKSFVGMHPVAWVHGMTVGEFARMIVGEGWLGKGARLKLEIVPCEGYTHTTQYIPRVSPSPNLPNIRSILLYPSLAFFEGTTQSVGRGTDFPFQVVGSPRNKRESYFFVPVSRVGAKQPLYCGDTCYGINLRSVAIDSFYTNPGIRFSYLFAMRRVCTSNFFIKFFNQLAGTPALRMAIEQGKTEHEIRETWTRDLVQFKKVRKKYLLYEDFE